jgi:hypothetical protein
MHEPWQVFEQREILSEMQRVAFSGTFGYYGLL